MDRLIDGLNTTTKDDGDAYWHIHLAEDSPDSYSLLVPKRSENFRLQSYQVKL